MMKHTIYIDNEDVIYKSNINSGHYEMTKTEEGSPVTKYHKIFKGSILSLDVTTDSSNVVVTKFKYKNKETSSTEILQKIPFSIKGSDQEANESYIKDSIKKYFFSARGATAVWDDVNFNNWIYDDAELKNLANSTLNKSRLAELLPRHGNHILPVSKTSNVFTVENEGFYLSAFNTTNNGVRQIITRQSGRIDRNFINFHFPGAGQTPAINVGDGALLQRWRTTGLPIITSAAGLHSEVLLIRDLNWSLLVNDWNLNWRQGSTAISWAAFDVQLISYWSIGSDGWSSMPYTYFPKSAGSSGNARGYNAQVIYNAGNAFTPSRVNEKFVQYIHFDGGNVFSGANIGNDSMKMMSIWHR